MNSTKTRSDIGPRDVKKVVRKIGSMDRVAELVGVSRTTIRNWTMGKYKPLQPGHVDRLRYLMANEPPAPEPKKDRLATVVPLTTNGTGNRRDVLSRLDTIEAVLQTLQAEPALESRLARLEQILGVTQLPVTVNTSSPKNEEE